MRVIIIGILLLILIFAGHAIYSRSQADRLLARALANLPGYPAQSYLDFKPILGFNELISLGKVGEAKTRYLAKLSGSVREMLEAPVPEALAFAQAKEALGVVKEFGQATGMDTRSAIAGYTEAGKDAVGRIKEKGTLSAWESMIDFFSVMRQNNQVPPSAFKDFDAWMNEQEAVPKRPMGIRDALQNADRAVAAALNQFGVTAGGSAAVPAPGALGDAALITAEKTFNQAQGELDHFLTLFREPQMPPELMGMSALIVYDKAAIKLAHLQDRGATLGSAGSNYIAELTISANSSEVPSPSEMLGAFTQETEREFRETRRLFSQAIMMPEPMRAAGAALGAWGEALLKIQLGQPGEAAPCRQEAERWAAGATFDPGAGAIVQAMRASGRPLLLTRMPGI